MENNKLTNKKSEFRTGDKILFQQEGRQEVLTLQHIALPKGHEGKAWKIKEASGWLGEEQFRHATDEEVYWLETLDRNKVPGFMLGDIYVREDGSSFPIDTTSSADYAKALYTQKNFQGIYPSMSFERFKERGEQE